MQIVFKVNIGSRDAASLGLNFENCTEGAKANVSDDQAASLIARGVAAPFESKVKTATEVKAVPSAPEVQGK
jgi:hypothetical protein